MNGTFAASDQSWSIYVNNVYRGGHTASWGGTVWLVPNNPTDSGVVNVDLSAALGIVANVLQNNYGWAPVANTYWLDTIAFGIEYGPADADPYGSGPATFSFDLSKYCLSLKSTVSDAT